MSTAQSAALIVSSSCSTTIKVLPKSRSRQSLDQPPVVPLVQPDAGLVQHVENADQSRPIWVASRIRCASPPDRLPVGRLSDR